MTAHNRDVVVTGIGLVTALGSGVETVWTKLLSGADGTRDLSLFAGDDYKVRRACQIAPNGSAPRRVLPDITLRAAREALLLAGLPSFPDGLRSGLFLGTLGSAELRNYEHQIETATAPAEPMSSASLLPGMLAAQTAENLGCAGPVQTFVNACSSGNHAIAAARRWIQAGRCDVIIAGGADVLSRTQYTHFHNLRSLAPDYCRPFDRNRRGLVIGEGAAFLILEAESHARARGAPILGRVLGTGSACDAHHMTAPDPSGEGARRSILAALADAEVSPAEVDYVSAHGTGTRLNDRVEAQTLHGIFGESVPASSVKSMVGHCMGAASAIESVVCVLCLRDQVIPPTTHYEEADPECPIDCVPNQARAHATSVAVNVAFAFGGNNCTVAFGQR